MLLDIQNRGGGEEIYRGLLGDLLLLIQCCNRQQRQQAKTQHQAQRHDEMKHVAQ